MKRILSLLLFVTILLYGCEGDKKQKNEIIDYLNNKYSESFSLVKYSAGKEKGGSPTIMYVKDKNGEKAVIKVFQENETKRYLDSYISAKKADEVKSIIRQEFSEFYNNFSVETNLYKTIHYKGNSLDVSTADYLSDDSNGMRMMIYINSDDTVEQQREKIKEFSNKLKSKKIYIETLYFAFFEKDSHIDTKSIKNDYTYEYAIDIISRNEKYKKHIKNEYYSFFIRDKQEYNYQQKT